MTTEPIQPEEKKILENKNSMRALDDHVTSAIVLLELVAGDLVRLAKQYKERGEKLHPDTVIVRMETLLNRAALLKEWLV